MLFHVEDYFVIESVCKSNANIYLAYCCSHFLSAHMLFYYEAKFKEFEKTDSERAGEREPGSRSRIAGAGSA